MDTISTTFGLNPDGSIDTQDNGQGFFGYNTRDKGLVGFSLPPDLVKQVYGSRQNALAAYQKNGPMILHVTNPATGAVVDGPVVDIGPGAGPVSRGVGLDSTYAATKALGLTGKDPVQYSIASAPGGNAGIISAGMFGTKPDNDPNNIQNQLQTNLPLPSNFTPTVSPSYVAGGAVAPNTITVNPSVAGGSPSIGTNLGQIMSNTASTVQNVLSPQTKQDVTNTQTPNAGTALVNAIPQLTSFAHGLVNGSSDPASNAQYGLGGIGNLLHGIVGGGGRRLWNGSKSFGASIGLTNSNPTGSPVNLSSSSGNGSPGGLGTYFSDHNKSSNSTGPTGDQADMS
jgi:hypothetical protein